MKSSATGDDEEMHSCCDCGQPTSVEEPLCWNCECGQSHYIIQPEKLSKEIEMGIDIYMRWDKQSDDERQGQYTGFDTQSGFAGYLREAYHGNIYATRYLVHEAFADDVPEKGVAISCNVLRERLPEVLKLHIQRHKETYGEAVKETDPSAKSFTDFVELAERLTMEHKHPTIIASY